MATEKQPVSVRLLLDTAIEHVVVEKEAELIEGEVSVMLAGKMNRT